jgi:hypothetical protein
MPRVFRRNNVNALQDLESTQGDIAQIADRCGDDEKHSVSSIQNLSLAIPNGVFCFQQAEGLSQNESVKGGKHEN